MKISKERLETLAGESGFRAEMLEKVLHLIQLLNGFAVHPYLQGRLALKGGTAMSLFYWECPRLSVDIDLNYIGALEREKMLEERPRVEEAIKAVCSRENFQIRKIPTEHAGGKWRLNYESALGQSGNLEVDMNYLLRAPLWPVHGKSSFAFGTYQTKSFPTLDLHELAGGKLAAFLSRQASRDLFDAHRLLTQSKLDPDKLRLAFVLYGAMSRKDWRTVAPDDIAFDGVDLNNRLLPLLKFDASSGSREKLEWAENLVEECKKALRVVLPMREHEREFLNRLLDHGEIKAELLTDDAAFLERIQSHPGLEWKALNVRQHRSR